MSEGIKAYPDPYPSSFYKERSNLRPAPKTDMPTRTVPSVTPIEAGNEILSPRSSAENIGAVVVANPGVVDASQMEVGFDDGQTIDRGRE